ncbi:hypothetical protein [Streptomyces sp. NPDC050355]|uniref:hypothetical protein n=1 Tax=Streptomyces sp. NPDC050355 TaxID=3365609 RepID=UPI00378C987B
MIRIVSPSRLAALQQDSDRARARLREVQQAADRAYAGHLRTVWNLTDEVEAANKDAEAAHARAAGLEQALARANAELESARGTVADLEGQIKSLNADLDVMVGSVVLLNYGKLHSVHPDQQAAERYAASIGVGPGGWRPAGDGPVAESAWSISPLSRWAVADGGDDG